MSLVKPFVIYRKWVPYVVAGVAILAGVLVSVVIGVVIKKRCMARRTKTSPEMTGSKLISPLKYTRLQLEA